MRTTRLLAAYLLVCAAFLFPDPAQAQYKNTAFGLDGGFWYVTQPAAPNGANTPVNERPLRLETGARLGGETNFKLDQDHWWFTGRVNVGFLTWGGATQYDEEARDALGTLMAVQGSIGIRYLILTDKVRPYLQVALSYLRLLSFGALSGENCNAGTAELVFCTGTTYQGSYMSHPNVGGIHLQPGIELIISRDTAVHLFLDAQRWILFGPPENWAFVINVGVLFFT
jgi:hypothetical protein